MKKRTQITILLMLLFISANAQEEGMYYVDFEPDTCKFITWSSFVPSVIDSLRIDVDNDGLYDVWITGYVQHGALLPLTYMSPGWELCYPDENTVLDSDTIKWESYDDWTSGCFQGKYGFRYKLGDEVFYGWMSAYCDMKTSKSNTNIIGRNVYVDKFAFCIIPNYPIQWGQIDLTGVKDKENAFAVIHPNPTNGFFSLTGQGLKTAKVFNAIGQQVATARGEGERLTVDLNGLPAGVYFVNVTDKEGRKCVRKVVKE